MQLYWKGMIHLVLVLVLVYVDFIYRARYPTANGHFLEAGSSLLLDAWMCMSIFFSSSYKPHIVLQDHLFEQA